MGSDNKKAYVYLAYAGSVGFAFVLLIFAGVFVGTWLDRRFDTSFFFTGLLILVAVLAGCRNVQMLIKKSSRDDDAMITNLKSEPHRPRPEAPTK